MMAFVPVWFRPAGEIRRLEEGINVTTLELCAWIQVALALIQIGLTIWALG